MDRTSTAEELAGRAREEVTELAERAAPLVESAVETVTGVLEEAGSRGSAAWAVLRSGDVPAGRRWPVALSAAAAGAAAGAAVAWALGRVRTQDAPEALDPADLQAVVDRPDGAA